MLQDNGGDDLSVSTNGAFSFATKLANGAAYSVTVKTNPSGQSCSVANGAGTIAGTNIANVAVTCGTRNNGFSATYRSTDANGVDSYDVCRQRPWHTDAESARAYSPGRGRASQLPLCAAG